MRLRTRNDGILERLEPFLVAMPWHRSYFDLAPFGIPVPASNFVDPTRMAASVFLDRLEVLDRLTFGPKGMPMPRWIFSEAAEIPGAIFGFAIRAERLAPDLRRRLVLKDHATDIVPLSMYIAIPARPPHTWVGHNLASLNPVVPELDLHGLASMTKAMALKVLHCREQLGATQWDSAALHIHTRFGPLELLTAWTPAHSEPATLTYRVGISDEGLRHALGDTDAHVAVPVPNLLVVTTDTATMKQIQASVESGTRFTITGPPHMRDDGATVVPLART